MTKCFQLGLKPVFIYELWCKVFGSMVLAWKYTVLIQKYTYLIDRSLEGFKLKLIICRQNTEFSSPRRKLVGLQTSQKTVYFQHQDGSLSGDTVSCLLISRVYFAWFFKWTPLKVFLKPIYPNTLFMMSVQFWKNSYATFLSHYFHTKPIMTSSKSFNIVSHRYFD